MSFTNSSGHVLAAEGLSKGVTLFLHPQIQVEFHTTPERSGPGKAMIRFVVFRFCDHGGLRTLAEDRDCLREVDAYLGTFHALELVVLDAHGHECTEIVPYLPIARNKLRWRCTDTACQREIKAHESDPSAWSNSGPRGHLHAFAHRTETS